MLSPDQLGRQQFATEQRRTTDRELRVETEQTAEQLVLAGFLVKYRQSQHFSRLNMVLADQAQADNGRLGLLHGDSE